MSGANPASSGVPSGNEQNGPESSSSYYIYSTESFDRGGHVVFRSDLSGPLIHSTCTPHGIQPCQHRG